MDNTNIPRLRLNLKTKLMIGFSLISIFVAGITAFGLYTTLSAQVSEEFQRRALNAVSLAMLQQNGDEFEQIASASDPLYEKFRVQNLKIRRSDPDFAYVFTVSKDNQGLYFKVDAGEPGETNIAAFGERYTDPSEFFASHYDVMEAAIIEPEIYTDQYGSFISAYAPIFNSSGNRVGAIGIDILANVIMEKQQQIVRQSIVVALIGTLLGIAFGFVAGSLLTDPITKLTNGAKKLSSGDLTYRTQIATGDEIEDLGIAFNAMANELQMLISNLEQRVDSRTQELARRTRDLENLSFASQEQARKLRAIAEIARSIAQVQNLDRLLPTVATVVSQEFGFYHVGIFLNDSAGEYAILRASNSEGGRRMLARVHRLKIGEVGLVGDVAAKGKARIALETGADAAYFNNPDLPDTRSEIALPLQVGRNIIGVMDVQSEKPAAFKQEDVELLSILADQIAIAIQNTNLFTETERALRESESVARQYVQQQWQELFKQEHLTGVRYTETGIFSLEESAQAQVKNTGRVQSAPIKLRNEILGSINIQLGEGAPWGEDELDILEATAERVALAIENARLLQDAQRRASKERIIGDISTKLSSSVNIDNILRTALQELGHVIPGSEIYVEFEE